jgi:putative oxidoreductase
VGSTVQRLFSTFADGWPGTGLLLQRSLLAGTLLFLAISAASETAQSLATFVQILQTCVAMLLLIGLWTPLAGITIFVAELSAGFSCNCDARVHFLLATAAAAIAMTGPGAWSIDARLFGRKRIDAPKR